MEIIKLICLISFIGSVSVIIAMGIKSFVHLWKEAQNENPLDDEQE